MALNLKALQAKLLEQQAKKDRAATGQKGFSGDNTVYPFWNNPDNTTATMRFLPDGDESNDLFWLERLIIKLPFPGVKGSMDAKPVEVQVPCIDMWKANSCPITAEIRPWWKDKSLEDMARKYYRKKSFLFQGFVPSNPNKDDVEPENPIRRFIINPSIFDLIKSILMDPDLENSPTDYESGRDFYLNKVTKGAFANYTASKWAMKERALNEQELTAIATYGLWNLSSFLPKKPDDEHLNAMMEMFHASVNEELYDADRWGQFYRPTGMRTETIETGESVKTTSVSIPKIPDTSAITAASIINKVAKTPAVVENDEPPFDVDTPAPVAEKPKMQSPQEILEAIRRRQAQK